MLVEPLTGKQSNNCEQSMTESSWPDPIPFGYYSKLPEFPIKALDGMGAEIVMEASDVVQIDPGLAGNFYLGVLSTCLNFEIDLITHKEKNNLYLAAFAPSGERKSATARILTQPIYDYQLDIREKMQNTIRIATINYNTLEKRLNNLQKWAAEEDDPIKRQNLLLEANDISKQMHENPVPENLTLVVDDITTEELGKIMVQNNERMAILSAESGILQLIAGYYCHNDGNLDLYLKSYSGDAWSCNRVGRNSQSMMNPTLTISISPQHAVLTSIGQNKQFRGRGLLSRFLYSICKPQAGFRPRQIKSIPDYLLRKYKKHVYKLLNLPTGVELKLSAEAHSLWNNFYNEVETEMRPGACLENIADWGSKLPGSMARISGLLHLADNGIDGIDKPISADILTASAVFGAYFKEHALVAFGLMSEDKSIKSGKKILDYLRRNKPEKFKGRDVLLHAYFKDRSMAEIRQGLEILVERSFIREVKNEYSGVGRPEAVSYEINPKLNIR